MGRYRELTPAEQAAFVGGATMLPLTVVPLGSLGMWEASALDDSFGYVVDTFR